MMILKIGPFIIQAQIWIGKVGRVPREHKREIDRLLREDRYIEAVRYCHRYVVEAFVPARAYVQHRKERLELRPTA